MPYTEQQQASIKLAESIARKEMELDLASGSDLPEIGQIRDNLLAIAGGLYASMVDDPLAQALLSQARQAVRKRKARAEAIEKTSFGELLLGLAIEQGDFDRSDTPTFDDENSNLIWHEFLGGVKQGNIGYAFLQLDLLLRGIKFDLAAAELPPVPDPYVIPKD